MKKTKKQIKEMTEIIEQEIQGLPETNVFGESNDDSRTEMQGDLRALKMALEYPKQISLLKNVEVRNWLTGQFSTLNDYLS